VSRSAILVHGLASNWEGSWAEAGWPELLEDLDIVALPFELPGHGASPLAPDAPPAEVEAALRATDPAADIAIGFSSGAVYSLRAAAAAPGRFAKLVLLGFGDGMWTPPGAMAAAADRLLSAEEEPDTRLLRQMAVSAGNSIERVAGFLRANPGPPPIEELAAVTADTLIVLGERDAVGPADRAAAALPRARVVVLPGVDHYRTPGSPGAMAAVLDFLT